MIRSIIVLLVAYIMAAPLTDKISMDLSQTEWTNIWTYVIWLFSGAIWAAIIIGLFTLFAVIADR